ncbi:P-loop containing nucleoside triphosphate hydrolase, partial [Trinorchestia longiramus]
MAELDDYEPEDDYRDIPVEPTPEDFSTFEVPLIRRNITRGAYKNAHNYLDVQFRLLREDFVRPLREGVCQARSGKRATNDVRLYRRVTFRETTVVSGEIVNLVKLNLPKTFKVESSKRLLFGNVMCFSADDFASYFLATIAAKDEQMLRQGLIGVKLLSQENFNPKLQYTVVESRAFFISYKHVLKALQLMDENTIPLAEHIIFAQQVIEPPEYLLNATVRNFDLRVVLDPSYIKATKPNKVFPNAKTVELPVGFRGDLEAIPVLNANVLNWPLASKFGLDESQLAALHAALTKRLVIIQGPPGTGKTFLGLKITQVLLHNSHAWARKELEIQAIPAKQQQRKLVKTVEVDVTCPVLVLCYTNHALDQFLEGMLKFTKKIIRIGSRSKSEVIQRYQINEYVSSLKKQRLFPAHLHHAKARIRSDVVAAENNLKRRFNQLEEILCNLAFNDRCLLYAIWREKLMAKIRERIRPHERELHKLLNKNQEVKNSEYLYVARQADVVGLTTTGAAQFQAVVQELKPRIVIIEEAAEILEAHVVASLNVSCEHLIMIGDHQQLKPSPTVYQLARDYGLDTSLFERMINNGVMYQTLQYQHRMRPEISSLLVPSIYEHLKDHQSVHGRPHIRGVEKSVFFITHKEKEVPESDDNNSHSNKHEAAFIMRLARHLVLQGYSTEQITVLTPYSGQFFLLKKEQRKYVPTCDGMRISIVDNFQGEENDI